jgi:hypothetical protein
MITCHYHNYSHDNMSSGLHQHRRIYLSWHNAMIICWTDHFCAKCSEENNNVKHIPLYKLQYHVY